jgi:hypothetical protein
MSTHHYNPDTDSGEYLMTDTPKEHLIFKEVHQRHRIKQLEDTLESIVKRVHKTWHFGRVTQEADYKQCRMLSCEQAKEVLMDE